MKLVIAPQPVQKNKKKSKRENNRNDKKKNQQGYAGKNKMSHNTEWQMGKKTIYQKTWK